jgi:hypothetical protein
MSDLWDHYTTFHREMEDSTDLDPVYPVFARIAEEAGMTFRQRIWLVLCHAAYYHAGSALAAFSGTNGLADARTAPLDLPCGTERRGHRNPVSLLAHLNDLAAREHAIVDWCETISMLTEVSRETRWEILTGRLATIHGNGRWAAYKTAELLQHIAGLPIEAPDMGHAHSTGPRKGLALLYEDDLPQGDDPASVKHLDSLSREVVSHLRASGLPADYATAETTLCDFHALAEGRYYVGHDIDLMQEQLTKVPSTLTNAALAARQHVIPLSYVGEISGWDGVDRPRRRVYRDTGKIVTR